MNRFLFGLATVAILGVCAGSASAQTVVVPTYPQPVVPISPPVVAGTVVTSPGIAVTGAIVPPAIVVGPVLPPIRFGYPYYYGRSYYYPYHYHHYRW